jgi:hypothetical protein
MNDVDSLFSRGSESGVNHSKAANTASNGLIPLLIITISSCLLIGMLMYKIDNTDRYRAE